jgi:hypothetical protein
MSLDASFLVDQGDVSAIAFTDTSQLATASHVNCVTTYDIGDAKIDTSRRPPIDGLHWTYWYVVRPIYTVFPKPGKLGDLVTYVLTGKEIVSRGDRGGGPVVHKLDIWAPVWSNLLFLSVMLAVACFLIQRRDY